MHQNSETYLNIYLTISKVHFLLKATLCDSFSLFLAKTLSSFKNICAYYGYLLRSSNKVFS